MRAPLSVFAFLAVLIVAGMFFLFSGEARSETPPPWTLQDVNGKTVSLSDFKGKIVVLNFWATFCPPCVVEIPDLVEIQKEFQDKGVVVIGISADSVQPSAVAAFAKARGMNYPILMITDKVSEDYGADVSLPITLIIKPDGKIAFEKREAVTKKTLEREIQKLLPK